MRLPATSSQLTMPSSSMSAMAIKATVVGSSTLPPNTHTRTVTMESAPICHSRAVTGPICCSSPAAHTGTSRLCFTLGG